MAQTDAEREGVPGEGTPDIEGLDNPVVEEIQTEKVVTEELTPEPVEQVAEAEKPIDPATKKYLDMQFQSLAETLSKGNQKQMDRLADRISKVVQPEYDDPATEVLVTYWEAKGGSRDTLPDTSKAKNPVEAFEILTKAARRLGATKPAQAQSTTVSPTPATATPPTTTTTKPVVTTATKTVPKKAGKGGGVDTVESLRADMASGKYDIQQYMDKCKAIGYNPTRD